jgi:hypothetical protein
MSSKVREHIRSNVIGYIALFCFAMGSTAYGVDGPLAGQNQVGSADIINGEVATGDLSNNSVVTGKIADETIESADVQDGSLNAAELAPDAIFDDSPNAFSGSTRIANGAIAFNELAPNAVVGSTVLDNSLSGADITSGSVAGSDLQDGSVGAADLGTNSVGSDEVAPDSLGGGDVDESTLAALDAKDVGSPGCDPSTETFVDCGSLSFTTGRTMPVLTIFHYSYYGFVDVIDGFCRTTLDGSTTSTRQVGGIEENLGQDRVGPGLIDVLTVGPGTHTIGLQCNEQDPQDTDLALTDIRIAAVELGMD